MSLTRTPRRPLLAVAGLAAALSLGLTACGMAAEEPTGTPTPASSLSSASASASPSTSTSSPAASATETRAASASASETPSASASASTAPTTAAPASSSPASSTPAAAPSSTPAAAAAGEATVYWVSPAGSGHQGVEFPGCGDLLVESTVKATGSGEVGTAERVEAGIEALLEDRTYEHSNGLVNALYQSELSVQDVAIEGDTVTVDLTGQPMSAGSCADPQIIGQLEYTATSNAGTYTAEVLVDGTPIQEFMSQQG
ncbi:MAG: hypothetical protein MOP51_1368 [Citricoccus sp.]|nr:hypothetical protein [Citricoccus sp. WCRC_4]